MEVLDKILAWIKNIIIDWRIGTIGFVGFTTALIILKDSTLIIGMTITASMVVVDIVDKNIGTWYEKHQYRKLQKELSDPDYQNKFFDERSDEEMKILTKIYRVYPNGCPLPFENAAVDTLVSQFAIKRIGPTGISDFDSNNNRITVFMYILQPWVKTYLDKNKNRLKRNV